MTRLFRKTEPAEFRFPGPEDRTTIVGGTGSGKSVAALWQVAEGANYDRMPWVFIDYKGEAIIDALIERELAELLPLEKALPQRPGLYVVKPHPRQQGLMADWLWKVYERGRVGLFFDELSMVPRFGGEGNSSGPLTSIYTQGRSKHIPVYGLVQRPVNVDIQAFAQAQFIGAFNVARLEDRKRVAEYIPDDVKLFDPRAKPLPPYYMRWWDQKRGRAFILRPAPQAAAILDIFEARVEAMRERV